MNLADPLQQIRILLDPYYEPPQIPKVAANHPRITWPVKLIKVDEKPSSAIFPSISKKSHFIWLGDKLSTDPRFDNAVAPDLWDHFWDVSSCQKFIENQQFSDEKRSTLVLSSTFARALFTVTKNIRAIKTIYLYVSEPTPSLEYVDQYSNIQGVHASLDSLFEQFRLDLQSNSSTAPTVPHVRRICLIISEQSNLDFLI